MSDIYEPGYADIDFRKHPEKYQIGRGEQGVLMVEPYKSEILPHWRFKSQEEARKSATKIYDLYLAYKKERDFVGMDMARKFLQMGFTRARRYANHPSGTKYNKEGVAEQAADWATNEKALAAKIFQGFWETARNDAGYLEMKEAHKKGQRKYFDI